MFNKSSRQLTTATSSGKKSDFQDISKIAMHCTITRLEKYDGKYTLLDFTCVNRDAVHAAIKLLRAMGDGLARYDKKQKAWIVADTVMPRIHQFLPIGEYLAARMGATLASLGQ